MCISLYKIEIVSTIPTNEKYELFKKRIPKYDFNEDDFERIDEEEAKYLESRAISISIENRNEVLKKAWGDLFLYGDVVFKIESK